MALAVANRPTGSRHWDQGALSRRPEVAPTGGDAALSLRHWVGYEVHGGWVLERELFDGKRAEKGPNSYLIQVG